MIPLGGLGEIGRNMMLYEYDGQAIAVDVGLMFPEEEMLGVDLVIPEFAYVRGDPSPLQAVFLTHGHEDHIGALPFLLREINVPVFCTRLTRGLVEVKLREHRLLADAHIQVVEPGQTVNVGPFSIEFFSVSHSIPDSAGLIIETRSARLSTPAISSSTTPPSWASTPTSTASPRSAARARCSWPPTPPTPRSRATRPPSRSSPSRSSASSPRPKGASSSPPSPR